MFIEIDLLFEKVVGGTGEARGHFREKKRKRLPFAPARGGDLGDRKRGGGSMHGK